MDEPADVITEITWNDATQVVSINDGEIDLTEGDGVEDHYTITDVDGDTATLTISEYYLDEMAGLSSSGDFVELTISFDEGDDATFTITGVRDPEPVDQTTHNVNGVDFDMRLALAATFPTGTEDDGTATVDEDFWIAETQVTYELWYEVRTWAEDNGYTFENEGMEGSKTEGGTLPDYGSIGEPPTEAREEPVTMVSWYDSIVWCNALSEYMEYSPVYTIDGEDITSSAEIDHTDVMAEDRNGFRLPTSDEWELAARWRGTDTTNTVQEVINEINFAVPTDGIYWTKGNSASGATADHDNVVATQDVAWYVGYSDGKTQPVGLKTANALGLYDMSGNVWELCFTFDGSNPVIRGGRYSYEASYLRVGFVYSDDLYTPSFTNIGLGFRPVRAP